MRNSQHLRQMVKARAKAELQRRALARTDGLEFARYIVPKYEVGAHTRLLFDKLNAVERGEIKRLMVFMPPRHGKSMATSELFPAWFLGKNPKKQVVVASYAASLAQSFGRKVRNLFGSSEFASLFPGVGLASDSAAKDNWHTNNGGVFTAVGIGGGLTGKGADIAIIDDPIKDMQDADSETIRENTWDWYRSVLRTRLMPGGAIVVVLTRWHQDDLAGRLLDDMDAGHGEQWDVVSLPAVADSQNDALGREIGEALWPARFPLSELEPIRKADAGGRTWSALYQQKPTPGEGLLFKTAMLGMSDTYPECVQTVRRWDLAATKQMGSRDPDWTVGVKMGVTKTGRFVVLDVVRLRGGPDEVEQVIVATAERDGHHVHIGLPQDPGQAGVAQVQYLTRRLARFIVKACRETGDKATRASPLASQVNVGNVDLVRAPWNRAYIEEMASFPAASHDDQVDASSGAFEMVAPPNRSMPSFAGYKSRTR